MHLRPVTAGLAVLLVATVMFLLLRGREEDPRDAAGTAPQAAGSPILSARPRADGTALAGRSSDPAAEVPIGGPVLEGQIVDRTGHGIPGAQVNATQWNATTHVADAILSVTTDADGRFRVAVPTDPDASFGVDAPGFRRRSFKIDPGGERVVVPLWRNADVRIRVRFEERPPPDGSRLRVVLRGLDGQEDGWGQVFEVADGFLVFPSGSLGEGVHRLSLDGPAGFTDTEFVTPEAGAEEIVVPVRLDPGGVVRGVVRGIDGAPIDGAEVDVRDPEIWLGMSGAHSVRSGGAGQFRLQNS